MANNKSIGQFIAALRRVNGMTQMDVAERLNVSNKTVSRWERDECAPDLSLIPSLAEMFGVSCDELIKGERIINQTFVEKGELRVEKQKKSLINRSVSSFETMIWISLALSIIGLICMFGISYGFYLPVVAFAVMLLFEVAAITVTAIATNRMRTTKSENELFENADKALLCRYNNCLGSFSYVAFFVSFSCIVLSIPLVLFSDSFAQSVLSLKSYIVYYALAIAVFLFLIYKVGRKKYITYVVGEEPENTAETFPYAKRMNILQHVLLGISAVLFVIAPYFDVSPSSFSVMYWVLNVAGVVALFISIAVFAVFTVKIRAERKILLFYGIRNIMNSISVLVLSGWHQSGWTSKDEYPTSSSVYERYDFWNNDCLIYAFVCAAVIYTAFWIIATMKKKRK